MKVQGRLMQARFIEIHQVYAKKKIRTGTFLTECTDYIYDTNTIEELLLA